ncbi:hypothetical protein PM8797T_09529 [Gimesia maris DSM 8797]|nr:hypothetical protein PM8797T_09529 [Gimesia maris DSM 8797]
MNSTTITNFQYPLPRAGASVGLPDSAGINVSIHVFQSIIKETPQSPQMKIPNHSKIKKEVQKAVIDIHHRTFPMSH